MVAASHPSDADYLPSGRPGGALDKLPPANGRLPVRVHRGHADCQDLVAIWAILAGEDIFTEKDLFIVESQ